MKLRLWVLVCSVAVLASSLASQAVEPGTKVTPVQISVWNPVQLAPDDWDVWGLRLNLPYGRNERVVGIDVGLVNSAIGFEGVQLGMWNSTGYPIGLLPSVPPMAVSRGVQIGVFNVTGMFSEFTGVQAGIFNMLGIDSSAGVQLGVFNGCGGDFAGVQVAGNFNMSGSFSGLQVTTLWNTNNGEGHGVQIALLNRSSGMHGLQVGLINIADRMTGVQIGLANIIKDSPVPFLPVINACF